MYASTQASRNHPGHKFQELSRGSSSAGSRPGSQQPTDLRKVRAETSAGERSTPAVDDAHDQIFGVGPRRLEPRMGQQASGLQQVRLLRDGQGERSRPFNLDNDDRASPLSYANLDLAKDNISDRGHGDDSDSRNDLSHLTRRYGRQSAGRATPESQRILLKKVESRGIPAEPKIKLEKTAQNTASGKAGDRQVAELERQM